MTQRPGLSRPSSMTMKNNLPIPAKYEFDDTPKAFKRMLQRKNGNELEYKNQKYGSDTNKNKKNEQKNSRPVSHFSDQAKNLTKKSDNFNSSTDKIKNTTTKSYVNKAVNTTVSSNTIRAKRKAHLQCRDLKKKLKRHTDALEYSNTTAFRKDVRDVVQEPPKLHQPKKTFKKVRDSKEEIRSWSEDDELAEE